MKVVLLGLEFSINNLGCEALSYSFVSELYEIAKQQGKEIDVKAVVFADRIIPYIPNTKQAVDCIKIKYKSPSFWKEISREFKSSDMIIDFTMGDSFSDIYGKKRFILDALIKDMAIRSGSKYILGPQTYGPYKDKLIKSWAAKIIKKSFKAYARDEKSMKLAEELSGREIILTTDIAFALPYEKKEYGTPGKIKIGFNPSGLLWKGGYTKDNQFSLSIDYQKYCLGVCDYLSKNDKYEVYLIPHVGTVVKQEMGIENDLYVCQLIQKQYPKMIILDSFQTPMDIKGYIASLDAFIGARMHATIGAFSSGVATIPVSYSRKFEGLYDSLNYYNVIHALETSTDEAIAKTIEYVNDYKRLSSEVSKSLEIVRTKQKDFRNSFFSIINEVTE